MIPTQRTGCIAFGVAIAVTGCAFAPNPATDAALRARSLTSTDQGVTVNATVLSESQAKDEFGVDLGGAGIQAIWLEIKNDEDGSYVLLSRNLDARYFTPAEAAIRVHRLFAAGRNDAIDAFFREHAVPVVIPPRSTVSGFAYVTFSRGFRVVPIDLLGSKKMRRFNFFVKVDSQNSDYERLNLRVDLTAPGRESLDLAALRAKVEALPRCVSTEDGKHESDPVNLVVVGRAEDTFPAFLRMGWDETQVIDLATAYSSSMSLVAGTKYRSAPMSALYLFGREQDIGLQKTRETVHERSHLRLWLTPWDYEGRPVWVGHASRDIGIKPTLSNWSLFTHVLDPDVDRERQYVVQDLIASQAVEKVGFAKGAVAATIAEPRENLSGDTYFTDGLRAVLILGPRSTPYTEVEMLDWEMRGFVK